ncbi:MAG: ATP-binding cassette domain-containing protein, partial [Thermomicrobiaceae bacterium]|nr:ATP-binding cassette domain-containing protein [Thermomicrobiaceae bacterium]
MAVARSTPVLTTRHLGLRLGGATIVEDVSLEVRRGEFVTIIGPNGAGKTTLFNLLSGLYHPTSGTIALMGRDVTRLAPPARARLGLGRTFQSSSLFPALSVLENVRIAAQAAAQGNLRLWRLSAWDREQVERARRALRLARLEGREDVPAGSLAYGDKRKLELAILLAAEPEVVLLDEPTAGMSVEDVPEMMRVIQAIHRE